MSGRALKMAVVSVWALAAILLSVRLLLFYAGADAQSGFFEWLRSIRVFPWNWLVAFCCAGYALVHVLVTTSCPRVFRIVIVIIVTIALVFAAPKLSATAIMVLLKP